MSVLNEKFFTPRKVCLQDDTSLIGLYAKVKAVLENHKIFVSNKIFSEQWDLCRNNLGNIKVAFLKSKKVFYALDYKLSTGVNEKVGFCVDIEKSKSRKIQLMYLQSGNISYKFNKISCQESVLIDRKIEKEFNR